MTRKPKKPSLQVDSLEQLLFDPRTGEAVATPDGKDPLAVLLGRRGGLKGGRARADALTAEQRSEIARTAARKRWGGDV